MTGSRTTNKPKRPSKKTPASERASHLRHAAEQNRTRRQALAEWDYALHEREQQMKCPKCNRELCCTCDSPPLSRLRRDDESIVSKDDSVSGDYDRPESAKEWYERLVLTRKENLLGDKEEAGPSSAPKEVETEPVPAATSDAAVPDAGPTTEATSDAATSPAQPAESTTAPAKKGWWWSRQ